MLEKEIDFEDFESEVEILPGTDVDSSNLNKSEYYPDKHDDASGQSDNLNAYLLDNQELHLKNQFIMG